MDNYKIFCSNYRHALHNGKYIICSKCNIGHIVFHKYSQMISYCNKCHKSWSGWVGYGEEIICGYIYG